MGSEAVEICKVPMTVAVALTGGRLVPDAVMLEVPAATPVTGTATEVAPARMVTVAGTVAAAVLLESRLMTTPPVGAGTERFSVRFWVALPTMVTLLTA